MDLNKIKNKQNYSSTLNEQWMNKIVNNITKTDKANWCLNDAITLHSQIKKLNK